MALRALGYDPLNHGPRPLVDWAGPLTMPAPIEVPGGWLTVETPLTSDQVAVIRAQWDRRP